MVLPQIHNSSVIPDLPFKNVSGLSQLNYEFIEKMNLGLYSPVFPIGKKLLYAKDYKSFSKQPTILEIILSSLKTLC